LTLYPCGDTPPYTSNVNFRAGQTVANQAFVKLSPTGSVCVFSSADTDVVIDLNAAFHPDAAPELVGFTPVRVLDTRSTTKLDAGQTIELDLGGDAGIDGAVAFALNLTVTEPEAAGFLTLYPCGQDMPTVSNLNYVPGQTVANHATGIANANGAVCLYTLEATHVVIDVEGAYL
jgi:hypothetical protein